MTIQLEDSDIEKLKKMSDLQKAILRTLIPEAPYAVHAEVLREAIAPFLMATGKREQRRELHEAADTLGEQGFIKYFCCFIDSYAMSPQYMNVADGLCEMVSEAAAP